MVSDNVIPTTDENEEIEPAEVLNNDLDFAIEENNKHVEVMACEHLSQAPLQLLFNRRTCCIRSDSTVYFYDFNIEKQIGSG
ncbi:MAG: hypothetical protein RLZZ262_505 [Bacteroidota bacterium]|jgi:hypothetical protein